MPKPAHSDERIGNAFHSTTKFIVSNSMEVFELSSEKAIELMSSRVKTLDSIKTRTVRVTPFHIQQLVLRSLLGSQQVLTETFVGEASCEQEEGSEADFFELTFDAGAPQDAQQKDKDKHVLNP